MDVARQSAQERAEREDGDGGRGRRASVPNLSAIQPLIGIEDGETQRVARQNGLHAERRHRQRLGNHRHGGVENGRVERFHEERDCDQPRQKPFDRRRGRTGNHNVRRAEEISPLIVAAQALKPIDRGRASASSPPRISAERAERHPVRRPDFAMCEEKYFWRPRRNESTFETTGRRIELGEERWHWFIIRIRIARRTWRSSVWCWSYSDHRCFDSVPEDGDRPDLRVLRLTQTRVPRRQIISRMG